MKPIRIFISSPGDVAAERDKARKVVEGLQKRHAGVLRLETVLWDGLTCFLTGTAFARAVVAEYEDYIWPKPRS